VSVAPMEPHFYALLLEKIGLDPATLPDQYDNARWPELRERFAEVFLTRTRDEWSEILEGTDACYAPVLTLSEARDYPHNRERGAFLAGTGAPELVPTPRLSVTPGEPGTSPDWPGADTEAVLLEAGFSRAELESLQEAGTIPPRAAARGAVLA
jgi:alpha-methylacyl-CoA racemase